MENLHREGSGKSFYRADCQDVFEFTTNWDLYPKWEAVKEQLLNASTGSPSTTYINHLTGSGGSFPFFVASGKITHGTYAPQLSTGILCRDSCSRYPDFPRKAMPLGLKEIDFLGLNQLTTDYINEHRLANIGIIPADFPGEALISAIIACNFR